MKTFLKNQAFLQNGIIKELYFESDQSCAELSEKLGKSIPSVTKALLDLIHEQKVVSRGEAASGGGRPPQVFALPTESNFVVAVAMDQLATRITILNMHNDFVAEPAMMELNLMNDDSALGKLENFINRYIKKSGIDPNKIIGVGIGMPGFVNNREGINYSYLPTGKKSLKQYLRESIGLPLWIDNDSSLVALCELRFGKARNKESVMVVNIGWGIGLGMILNGRIFRGYNGYAGELSHIPMSDKGKLCICGKRGCLETEASLLSVAGKVIEEINKGQVSTILSKKSMHLAAMGDAILEAAIKGDQFSIDQLDEMGFKIGKAIAILIHIIDPQTIILSGRGALVGNMLLAPIQNSLNKYCIPRLSANTEFTISEFGKEAELIGAAALVMENFNVIS